MITTAETARMSPAAAAAAAASGFPATDSGILQQLTPHDPPPKTKPPPPPNPTTPVSETTNHMLSGAGTSAAAQARCCKGKQHVCHNSMSYLQLQQKWGPLLLTLICSPPSHELPSPAPHPPPPSFPAQPMSQNQHNTCCPGC